MSLQVAAGQLFLIATDGVTGVELRVLEARRHPRLVADLCPGPCGTSFQQFLNVPGQLFFVTNHGSDGRVYRTDGTTDGTVYLVDGNQVGRANGRLVVTGPIPGYSQLWALDTASEEAQLIFDPFTHGHDAPGIFGLLGEFRGLQYFNTEQGLWHTDGTADRTRIVVEGVLSSQDFAVADGRMFFIVYGPGGPGSALWVSNGTTASSHALLEGVVGPVELVGSGERVFFSQGDELWTADRGSAERLRDADPEMRDLAVVGEQVFFSAHDATAGVELWTSDGTDP